MKKLGNRIEVMKETAEMTGGGLKKKDLMYNKNGKIISKKMKKKKYKQIGGAYELCKVLAYAVYNVHVLDKAATIKLNISNANDSTVLEYITKKKEIGDDDLTSMEIPKFILKIDIPFKKKHVKKDVNVKDFKGFLYMKSPEMIEKKSFFFEIEGYYLIYSVVDKNNNRGVAFYTPKKEIDLRLIKKISRSNDKFSLHLQNGEEIKFEKNSDQRLNPSIIEWVNVLNKLKDNIEQEKIEEKKIRQETIEQLEKSYSYYYYTLLYYTIDTAFYKDYEYIINRYIVMQYNRHLTTISNNNNNNLLPTLSKSLKNIFIYKETNRKSEIAKFFFNFIGEIDKINIIKVLKIYYLQKYNESKKIKEAEKNFITQKMVIKKETSIEHVYNPNKFKKEEKKSTKTTIFTDKDHLSYKVDLTISKFVKTGNIYDIGTLTVIRKTIISHRNEYIVINNPNTFRSKLCKIEITDT